MAQQVVEITVKPGEVDPWCKDPCKLSTDLHTGAVAYPAL